MKRGNLGGHWTYFNRLLRAKMAHLCAPCVLAMVIATPFLSGSIFEEGTVRMTCEGDKMDGTNWMQLLVMCMLRLKGLAG